MPANGTILSTTGAHRQAVAGVPTINGVNGPKWQCTKYRKAYGLLPSTCEILIPLAELHEVAPQVAGVVGGPLDEIIHGTTGSVVSSDGAFHFFGWVSYVNEGLKADKAIVRLSDAKYRLKGLHLVGSFWMDGIDASEFGYRQGWRAHFNKRGKPNGIIRNIDGNDVKVFCTPNYKVTEATDVNEDSTEHASYFTIQDILKYIRFAAAAPAAVAKAQEAHAWYPSLPDEIDWPIQWTNDIQLTNALTITRKAREMVLSMDVNSAIDAVLKQAGNFGLYCKHSDGANTLKIVRTAYDVGAQSTLSFKRYSGGNANPDFDDHLAVVDGNFNENSSDTYTRFLTSGDLVFIETRVSMDDMPASLQGAWGADDIAAAITEANALMTTNKPIDPMTQSPGDNGQYSDVEALAAMHRKYEKLFAGYRLPEEFEFQEDTEEEDKPRIKIGRPILASLLSSYLEGKTQTSLYDAQWSRRPIQFEYYDDVSTPKQWRPIPIQDGLTIDEDGLILIPNSRENGYTYTKEFVPATFPLVISALTPRKIRCTIAIPCDHRITAALKTALDDANIDETSAQLTDIDRISIDLVQLYAVDAQELYKLERRKTSWPIPESIPDGEITVSHPAATTTTAQSTDITLRDDSDLIKNHATVKSAELGNLAKDGEIIMSAPIATIDPGDTVDSVGDKEIKRVIKFVDVSFTHPQMTKATYGN